MIIYILVGLITLSTIFYMINYFQVDKKKVILVKGITSLQFVILGLYCATLNNSNSKEIIFILIGLSCGLVGDLLFGLKYVFEDKKKELYIAGIFFFFFGHIAYILSFFEKNNFSVLIFSLSIILFIITVVILKKSGVNFGSVRIFSYVYILCCALLISVSGANVGLTHEKGDIISFLGVASFLISDILLSYLYFRDMSEGVYKKVKMINILSYYIGQVLIALSICFII